MLNSRAKIFFVLIFFIQGCLEKTEKQVQTEPIVIDWNARHDDELSRHISISKVVRLETSPESSFGRINKLLTDRENRIFIMDSDISRSILVFDKEGKFVRKWVSGPGPYDFQEPTDFAINTDENTIHVLCYSKKKIFTYDLNTGQHLSDQAVPASAFRFTFWNNLIVFANGSLEDSFITIMKDSEEISSFIPNNGWRGNALPPFTGFQKSGTHIYFNPPGYSTIYELIDDFVTPRYTLIFESAELYNGAESSKENIVLNFQHFWVKNTAVINYQIKSNSFISLFDSKTNQVYTSMVGAGIVDPFDLCLVSICGSDSNQFISQVSAQQVKDFSAYIQLSGTSVDQIKDSGFDKVLAISPKIDRSDNAILIFTSLTD